MCSLLGFFLSVTAPTMTLRPSLVFSHVCRSLQGLDITGEQYGVFLNPIILSKLPNVIRLEWARHCEKKESDLEFLLSFIKREIETREQSAVFVRPPADPAKEKSQPRCKSSVSALQAPSCVSCIRRSDH